MRTAELAEKVKAIRIPQSNPDYATRYGHGFNDALGAVLSLLAESTAPENAASFWRSANGANGLGSDEEVARTRVIEAAKELNLTMPDMGDGDPLSDLDDALQALPLAKEPKPDGWHMYHVCGGVLRELTWSDDSALCVVCGQWAIVELTTGSGDGRTVRRAPHSGG